MTARGASSSKTTSNALQRHDIDFTALNNFDEMPQLNYGTVIDGIAYTGDFDHIKFGAQSAGIEMIDAHLMSNRSNLGSTLTVLVFENSDTILSQLLSSENIAATRDLENYHNIKISYHFIYPFEENWLAVHHDGIWQDISFIGCRNAFDVCLKISEEFLQTFCKPKIGG